MMMAKREANTVCVHLVEKKWRLIDHAGPLPVERSLHNLFYIEGVHMLALFGGFDGKSPLHGLTWIREGV
jgi:hypothetical protein